MIPTPDHFPGLYFVRISRTVEPIPPEALEAFGVGPDEAGWRWADVWFDRKGAEELARRHERSTLIAMTEETGMKAVVDVSGETATIAEVMSAREIFDHGGYEALGRALAAVEVSLVGRIKQLEAGVRFGDEDDGGTGGHGSESA